MFNFFKKLVIFTIIFSFSTLSFAYAQEPDVKTKLQETKESIDELVKAKDENSPLDISFRVATFQKVVDLALTETKDLKISLIALEIENEQLTAWREKTVGKLNEIINFYEEKLNTVSENKDSFTLEKIRQEAENFKEWREKNYLPLQNQIYDLLLIKKEGKAIQISSRRAEKISNDLKILERAGFKGLEKVTNLFKKANTLIKDAQKENERALDLFVEKYASPAISTSAISTSTAAISATTTTSTVATVSTTTTASSTTTLNTTSTKATSTLVEEASSSEKSVSTEKTSSTQSTSTVESKDSAGEKQEKSIRDLVSSSWGKIKGAYQIFIEMSDFVRESLQ